jgi:hypothetical protein
MANSSNSLFNSLRNSKIRYDEDKVRSSLVVIRYAKSTRITSAHKKNILYSLSDIIVKNVNNFFNLIRHADECRKLHEKDDIVGECYVILEKCIAKFDIARNKNFFWYYNKALSMGLFRLAKRVYKPDIFFKDFSLVYGHQGATPTSHIQQALDPLILKIKFTEEEQMYLQSKMDDERINEFLTRTGLPRAVYTRLGKQVKEKLQDYYDEFKSEPSISY